MRFKVQIKRFKLTLFNSINADYKNSIAVTASAKYQKPQVTIVAWGFFILQWYFLKSVEDHFAGAGKVIDPATGANHTQ